MTWFSVALDTFIFTSILSLPFVLIGLFLTFGRMIVDMIRRKRTIYGVTDKRNIILRGASEQILITLDMKAIRSVTFGERKDGYGFVFFNEPGRTNNLGVAAAPSSNASDITYH
ncbi:MAG: hypothetical protein MK081_15215 [Flavobacteriales bacterium]|nr:hypothetical protein [Flavobacteriales bacterium]